MAKTSPVRGAKSFREPRWFNPEDASRQLEAQRDWKDAKQLRGVLRWANNSIKQIREPRMQSAVIPFRRSRAGVEVMLITSRTSQQWIFPKGNIRSGYSTAESAAEEAREEAGVEGVIIGQVIGNYRFSRFCGDRLFCRNVCDGK